MLKTIIIEDKSIPMMSNAGTLKEYRRFFKKDMLGEIMKLEECIHKRNFAKFDSVSIAEMMWTCAYRANPDIKEFDEWLDSFESIASFIQPKTLKEFFELLNGANKTIVDPKKKKPPITNG